MSQTQRADEALELKRLQDHFIDMLASVFSFVWVASLTLPVPRTPESAQRHLLEQRRRC